MMHTIFIHRSAALLLSNYPCGPAFQALAIKPSTAIPLQSRRLRLWADE
jgi:hypothetical protein